MTEKAAAQTPQSVDPLQKQAADMKAAAEYLRGQVKAVYEDARHKNHPAAWRQALEYIRSYQDSIEEYVVAAMTLKGALERATMHKQDEYDQAWSQLADADSKTAVRRGQEMEGPRERYARFDLQAFRELREYRQTEQRLVVARELLDEMWVRYRAVNATREDIANIMRGYAFESSLER